MPRPIVAALAALLSLVARSSGAQVTVSPTGVDLNGQGATTVFLTFGGLSADLVPADAEWCGALVSAAPDVGERCDPATIFGRVPLRLVQARRSAGGAALTDIMSVPASVARRAWQAAARGDPADFFYVRRFTSTSGGPDVYASVICRLTSGGAGSPLALTDVTLAFDSAPAVPVLSPSLAPPPIVATIAYTGTGRLTGRWEVVRPGEDLPDETDLLPEAALPLEERGRQRRYGQLARFDLFLPPTGRARLPGPPADRLPRDVHGAYAILLRIEASDDIDSRSNLADVGAGSGFVSSGAVAGFAMPVLHYLVGSEAELPAPTSRGELVPLSPAAGDTARGPAAWRFAWAPLPGARWYRVEIERSSGEHVLDALVAWPAAAYHAPPFLLERAGAGDVRWRVVALDDARRELRRSAWRTAVLVAR